MLQEPLSVGIIATSSSVRFVVDRGFAGREQSVASIRKKLLMMHGRMCGSGQKLDNESCSWSVRLRDEWKTREQILNRFDVCVHIAFGQSSESLAGEHIEVVES